MSRIGCEADLFICLLSWFLASDKFIWKLEFDKRLGGGWLMFIRLGVPPIGGGIDMLGIIKPPTGIKGGGACDIDLLDFHAFSKSLGIGLEYGAFKQFKFS
jgi:hypothetical protein